MYIVFVPLYYAILLLKLNILEFILYVILLDKDTPLNGL